MRNILLVTSAVLVAGCGGPELSEEFGGQWSGTAIATVGSSTAGGPSVLSVSVDGDTASVTPVCDGASGTLALEGEGTAARWSGNYACPAVQSSCGPVMFSLQSATLALAENSTLRLEAAGQAVGCGRTESYMLSFVGTRR